MLLERFKINRRCSCADFGMAEDTDIPSQTHAHIIKGTLQYMAPEILEGENGAFSSMCDVWSAGIVMYVLLFGSFPFEGETREELLESISKGLDQKKLSKIGDRYDDLVEMFSY